MSLAATFCLLCVQYGTAGSEKGLWLNIDAFTKDFEEVMLKKIEINTLLDIKKNKQVPSKENFWPVRYNDSIL